MANEFDLGIQALVEGRLEEAQEYFERAIKKQPEHSRALWELGWVYWKKRELKEAISKHIFACLRKPVDSNELLYLLKTIFENGTKQNVSPNLSNFGGI